MLVGYQFLGFLAILSPFLIVSDLQDVPISQKQKFVIFSKSPQPNTLGKGSIKKNSKISDISQIRGGEGLAETKFKF